MDGFGNEFDVKLQIALAVFVVVIAPVFGYFYNNLMDRLTENEHSSLYVVIGVAVTIILSSAISWKSALLMAVLFGLTGLPMIIGEFNRTKRKQRKEQQEKSIRRRRLPYAANGLIDEIKMSGFELKNYLKKYLETSDPKQLHMALVEVTNILVKTMELKSIQEK